MHPRLAQRQEHSLLDDTVTCRKLELNKQRNEAQDHTALIDAAAAAFSYENCRDVYWNPENKSLLYGTPVWDQATEAQRLVLNHLYWVAYYAQIISAEIATIYFNQIAAAGLYTLEDFRILCETLDLETRQERAHISAFKRVGEEVEAELLGERLFTYPMRSPFEETMVFADANRFSTYWRKLQLQAYTLLSSSNAFLGSQYLLIRGLRTLNGKLIQHQLSRYCTSVPDRDDAPVPAQISHYHFLDESFHFNTSKITALDVSRSLRGPTAFERWVINRGVAGCQRDHYHFSVAVNGIFWYDPALFKPLLKLFCSPVFGMDEGGAREMLASCFGQETEGLHESFKMHRTALSSYKAFVESLSFLTAANRDMRLMSGNSISACLKCNRQALSRLAA
ncbi:MAG: P-aminobenzoate N-oxygenase AurF [Gammaproteobacteria bacterium]